ncbi:Hypothetical predicted protein [Podarcis lilfordi]|uniref:Uncharacterized protein n=1 Tax=Podarcis lilfordi TaxID=74358 RepID=A0AA35PPL5_9SAUR|nr:Hypothetical predicted protein [Podarcis lilfordi]
MMEAMNMATAFEKDNAHEAAHSARTEKRTHRTQRDGSSSVDSYNEDVHRALDQSDRDHCSQATRASSNQRSSDAPDAPAVEKTTSVGHAGFRTPHVATVGRLATLVESAAPRPPEHDPSNVSMRPT